MSCVLEKCVAIIWITQKQDKKNWYLQLESWILEIVLTLEKLTCISKKKLRSHNLFQRTLFFAEKITIYIIYTRIITFVHSCCHHNDSAVVISDLHQVLVNPSKFQAISNWTLYLINVGRMFSFRYQCSRRATSNLGLILYCSAISYLFSK